MNDDSLKLTTYFAERDRVDDGFLADALIDLYARHELQTSVLLRGVAGFGERHHVHTDRLLTLSEDLPAVAVAVDTRSRIEDLLPSILSMKRRGFVTLERARMLTGRLPAVQLPETLEEATKLTLYIGRQERVDGQPAFLAICEVLQRRGVAGATALLGVDGTVHGVRRRARFFGRNPDVPMMLIAVGDGGSIAASLPELNGLLERPLATLERVRVCKRDGRLLAAPHQLPGADASGLPVWQKLMIYTSEQARIGRRPIHIELLHRLRRSGARGATVLRGVWGYHGDHSPHGDRMLQLRRHVPVLTILVDAPDRIAESFGIVDEVTSERGLVTSEMVPALAVMSHERRTGGLRLARHHPAT
jgi:PII-like signaling protein